MSLIVRQQGFEFSESLGRVVVPGEINLGQTASNILDTGISKISDIGTSAFDTITSTSFLSTAGLTLLAGALSSKVTRPSLSFPALAGTTQVALSIGNLLKAGAISDNDIKNAEAGLNLSSKIPPPPAINLRADPSSVESLVDDVIQDDSTTYVFTLPKDVSSKYNMRLQFFKYDRDTRKGSTTSTPTDIVILPLPLNLVDVVSLQFNNVSLGPLLGEAAPAAEEIIDVLMEAGLVDAAAKSYQNLKTLLTQQGGELARLLARRALTGISPAASTAVDLAIGNTPNPHQVVAFNGVNLRTFRFSWRISPNNLRESQELEKFIFQMKRRTLPQKDRSGFLLQYPSIVKLNLKPETINNLFRFRNLFIDNFAVNYAPNNSLSFHKDDRPSEVEISMSFREFDIQTSNDYKNTSTSPLGQSETAGFD